MKKLRNPCSGYDDGGTLSNNIAVGGTSKVEAMAIDRNNPMGTRKAKTRTCYDFENIGVMGSNHGRSMTALRNLFPTLNLTRPMPTV
jgi:hypothetical protein